MTISWAATVFFTNADGEAPIEEPKRDAAAIAARSAAAATAPLLLATAMNADRLISIETYEKNKERGRV